MKAQLLAESFTSLALAVSFVLFVLLLFAGVHRYYQGSSVIIRNAYVNSSALPGAQENAYVNVVEAHR